jgi:glutathione S-transferase
VSSAPVIAAKLHLAIGAQLGVEISGFPHVAAHFKRMLERRSAKKLLTYEKRSE